MKNIFRRSRRKPQQPDKKTEPFFSKLHEAPTVKDSSFFQTKLTIGQPGDKYEQEADAVASQVVNQNGAQAVQREEAGGIQRYMTNAEFDERGTNTERIEEDKRIQEKPELQRVGEEQEEEPVQMQNGGMEEEELAMKLQRMGEEQEEEPVQMQSGGMEEEELSMKVQRKGEEEEEEPVQMQSGGMEEEELAMKVQRMGEEEEEEPVQMQSGGMEEEELAMKVQRKGEEEEEEPVQMQSGGMEEEELAMKVQRMGEEQEEEPVQMQGGGMEEEELAMKVQRMGEEQEEEPVQMQGGGMEEEELAMKVQRMGEEQEEEPVQMQGGGMEEEEVAMKVQRKEAADTAIQKTHHKKEERTASVSVEQMLKEAKGKGAPLPDDVRGNMEAEIGADFSKVRIHTGDYAVQMARMLKAQAFTRGCDIFFNEGKYDPNSPTGQHLLAHELAHVVQQKGAH